MMTVLCPGIILFVPEIYVGAVIPPDGTSGELNDFPHGFRKSADKRHSHPV